MDETVQVLVVDDEPALSALVAETLPRVDDRFAVETAASANEAIECLRTCSFDCVVSDYEMPGRDGIAFLETVRETHPELPFILYTGKGSEEVASEAISAGVTDFLQKGRDSSQYALLANRINNAVSSYRNETRAKNIQRIRNLMRDVNRLLARVGTRDDVETGVCRIISEAEPYRLAWIGEHDTERRVVIPRASAGERTDYLEDVTITTNDASAPQGPTSRAVLSGELATTQSVPDDLAADRWRDVVTEYGFRASAAIPLTFGDTNFGVLSVYSGQVEAFDEREQDLLVELGEDIAHALHRVEIEQDRKRYERMVNEMLEAAAIYDEDARFTAVNDFLADWYGLSKMELVGNQSSLVPLIRETEPGDPFAELLDGSRDAVTGELAGEFPGHGHAVLDYRLSPLNINGERTGVVGVTRDVTEQHQHELELETLVSNLPGMVYRCGNEQGWPMDVVRGRCLELSGYSAEALENDDISWGRDVIHPDDQERAWDVVQQAIEDEEPFELTYRILTKSGDERWVWERGQLVTGRTTESPRLEGF